MITKIGHFVETVTTAVQQNGIMPESRVIVREGPYGPEREIRHLKARYSNDGRSMELVIETSPVIIQ